MAHGTHRLAGSTSARGRGVRSFDKAKRSHRSSPSRRFSPLSFLSFALFALFVTACTGGPHPVPPDAIAGSPAGGMAGFGAGVGSSGTGGTVGQAGTGVAGAAGNAPGADAGLACPMAQTEDGGSLDDASCLDDDAGIVAP